jgi:periplasmic protein TonB
MESEQKNWNEIIFEQRNKRYGAYVLRGIYTRYLTISALTVILIFLIFMALINYAGINKKQTHRTREIRIINYNELTEPPSIEKAYAPPKKVAVKQPEVEKYVEPEVVKEEIVEPEITEKEDEIKVIDNSEESSEYANDTGNSEGIGTGGPVGSVFDINSQFPGGSGSFYDWIAQNLRYPVAAKRMGIEGTVIVGFMIDENGRIYDVTILESLHRLCDLEAMRLVKIMPLWVPGIKQGVKIRGRHSVEIPFMLK